MKKNDSGIRESIINALSRWLARKKRMGKGALVSLVMERQASWFPVYNRGQEATAEVRREWSRKLHFLSKRELILLLADNGVRNRFLGKAWPMSYHSNNENTHEGNLIRFPEKYLSRRRR